MLTEYETYLLKRAERSARGFHVWANGNGWDTVQKLASDGLVTLKAASWGEQWVTVHLSAAGERALLVARD